jgi:hypothetical protein
MAGEEVRLVGGRAFEPSADVDIEVTDRVSLELPVWRCTCGLEHPARQAATIRCPILFCVADK